MTDKELVAFAREFRRGILGRRGRPDLMCFAVCAPLVGLLKCHGVECEMRETDLMNDDRFDVHGHFWIRLADGRALDPTADQFGDLALPPVYLGAPHEAIHQVRCGRERP